MVEELKKSEVYEFLKGAVEALLARYPEEYEAVKYVVVNVISTLKRDFDLVFERIMEIPAFRRIIDWIMENLNPVSCSCTLVTCSIIVFFLQSINILKLRLKYDMKMQLYFIFLHSLGPPGSNGGKHTCRNSS